ncbi:MAG: hypothetical protein E6K80_02760 [Candidatus Eisenbacteria bacterium]|uniref:DUF5683 domain-containing protein n=1 Tax=Eiseniibacteriota bacterium TaxID=2212470 RepID=A0A538U9A9_UNCEI|nr:MAG: hypothetical protein E6K80_02760 [Candidatus Eisenbacteria bacterium]
MRRAALVVFALALAPAGAARAATQVEARAFLSPLALMRVEGVQPGLRLAQRAIEREWPAPGDSGLPILPHGRSVLGAMIFSAAVPGSGQLYAGSRSGLYYAAAEVAGWLGWRTLHHRADDLRGQARALAGSPDDTSSAWSFARYEKASGEDAATLRQLYAVDRDAFDQEIAADPRYASGWEADQERAAFSDLRRASDRRLSQSRATEGGLWINHVVAALGALRAARVHNQALGHGLELKAKGGWRDGRPEMVVTLQRRF